MTVQYAKSYIDSAVDSNDLSTLYNVIRVLDADGNLAEPLGLFLRLWEWTGATRSGVWQYYESIRIVDFNTISAMMERNELTEINARYRGGMDCWEEPRYCDDLDAWIQANEILIEETAMLLIEPHRKALYPTAA